MEDMHVVLGEESRVESCTFGGIEGLDYFVAGQRASLSTSANARRVGKAVREACAIDSLGLVRCGFLRLLDDGSKLSLRFLR